MLSRCISGNSQNQTLLYYRIPNPDKPVEEGVKDSARPPSFESTGESDPMNFI